MALTLAELLPAKTKEELRAELLQAMQGIGWVKKEGFGEGGLSVAGIAKGDYDIRVKVTTAGALGAAQVQLSYDAGATYGSAFTLPSGGTVVLASTGATASFENGTGIAADSFQVGDLYSIALTTPTLPSTSWHAGSFGLTVVDKDAEANEDFALSIQRASLGGFLSYARDAWMDLWLEEMYGLTRAPGQVAVHTVQLADNAGVGPFSISPGQLWVGTATGLRFTNSDGATVAQYAGRGGMGDPPAASLSFRAEAKGTRYNVSVGAINLLLTSIPGVGVTNPDLGSGTSLTVQGVNRETDAEALARAKLQWPSLGTGAVADAYRLWAETASSSVTRVIVRPDTVTPGNVLVYLAGPAGPVSGPVVTAVQAYIDPRTPLGSVATVASASGHAVTVSGTVNVAAGFGSTAAAQIDSNLIALFQGGLNSIGEQLPGIDIGGTVYVDQLIEQIQLATGVRNITSLAPGSDVVLSALQVATLVNSLTVVEV